MSPLDCDFILEEKTHEIQRAYMYAGADDSCSLIEAGLSFTGLISKKRGCIVSCFLKETHVVKQRN